MTINELLERARAYAENADRAIMEDGAFAMADTYANIALACATTAQAMILYQTTATIANDKGRVLMVDTGN